MKRNLIRSPDIVNVVGELQVTPLKLILLLIDSLRDGIGKVIRHVSAAVNDRPGADHSSNRMIYPAIQAGGD